MQRRTANDTRAGDARSELVALLLASIACVVVLTVSIVESGMIKDTFAAPWMTIGAITVGLLIVSIGSFWISRRARRDAAIAQQEAERARNELFLTQSVFEAEPQILVFWDREHGLRVITHTLQTVAGTPQDRTSVLQFSGWLDVRSAADLTSGLDRLFEEGRGFTMLLKTQAGGHVEADARAVGSRAVLRFRDVAGYKKDLVEVLEQHRHLSRDIKVNRTLLDALPVPVWFRDPQGRLEWVNASYVRAVEATSVRDVIDEQIELLDARQRATQDKLIDQGQAATRRMQLILGGAVKAHDILTVPIDGMQAAAAIDVAELETAQGELERQMAAYDRTLDRVSTAVAIFDEHQTLAFYNEAYRALWELDPDWLDHRPTDSQVLDRLRELSRLPSTARYREWKSELLKVYTTEQLYDDHWTLPDGRILHVVAEQRPDGGVTYLFDDQSEQLALESRYQTLIQVQRETLDSLNEGVAVFGTDGRLHLFNSSFTKFWQLSTTSLAQRPRIDELISHCASSSQDNEAWAAITDAVTSLSGETKVITGQIARESGAFLDYATTPLPDGGTLVTFADVTSPENYQRALLERNEALVAADRLKSRFISHVSYELRTPLTNIIGFTELLESPRTGRLSAKQREYLGDISASSRTLLSIIDDILDLATMDAGALELDYRNLDVRQAIHASVAMIADRAARAKITLDVGTADDVGSISADARRLRQILYNLLSNAVGFSKPGDTVRLSSWREKDTLVFEIADQGMGIPEHQQEQIFDRFVSRSQGSKHRGAGLGLSIVKSLVEHHRGTISIASAIEKGTTVTVRIPQAAPLEAGEQESEPRARVGGSS